MILFEWGQIQKDSFYFVSLFVIKHLFTLYNNTNIILP